MDAAHKVEASNLSQQVNDITLENERCQTKLSEIQAVRAIQYFKKDNSTDYV